MIYLQLCAAGFLGMILGGLIVAGVRWLERRESDDRVVDSGRIPRPLGGSKR